MYIEDTSNVDNHKNMNKQQQQTRKTRQESNVSKQRARSASTSSSHRRSTSCDSNSSTTKKNDKKQVKTSAPLTPVSLICYTVMYSDTVLLQKLLSTYPVEVNKLSDEGLSPLHFAAMDGNVQIMDILLENGAKLDIVDKKGRSVLEYAVCSGQFDAAQFLIQHGCDSSLIRDGYAC